MKQVRSNSVLLQRNIAGSRATQNIQYRVAVLDKGTILAREARLALNRFSTRWTRQYFFEGVEYCSNINTLVYLDEKREQISSPAETPEASTIDRLNASCCQQLQQIAKENEEAMAAFYDATLGKVYAVALHIAGSREAAEEVVEDVYLQVWQHADRYNPDRAKVMAWLQTICRSRALDYLRRNKKADTFTHPDPQSLKEYDQDSGESLNQSGDQFGADHHADPLDLLVITENKSTIHKALLELLPQQRQLLALAFFKGMSHQQIAEYTQQPLGTVKSHIRNALGILQKHLIRDGQVTVKG